MKRLYVKPDFHNQWQGQKLIEAIIETAQGDGYKEMVLDTIKPLERAISLYKKYVFKKIEPHYDNPTDDVIYMKLVFK